MLNLITMPFRCVRTARYALIAAGAVISGLGLWMQINGVPPAGEPVVSGLSGLMALVLDGPTTVFGIFSKIGGVLALLGLLGMTVHDMAPAKDAAPLTADPDPVEQPQVLASPQTASTWQERLAAKSAPQPRDRAAVSVGSVARIGLIGVVICAFLGVLGAIFLGSAGQVPTPANAASPAIATNLGHAMIRAHLAVAGVVTDTPPATPAAMSLPKFDPATILPWVKSQLAQALAGDQSAMITLSSLFGGIFVLLLGIKILVAVRRDKASQRTSTKWVSYS